MACSSRHAQLIQMLFDLQLSAEQLHLNYWQDGRINAHPAFEGLQENGHLEFCEYPDSLHERRLQSIYNGLEQQGSAHEATPRFMACWQIPGDIRHTWRWRMLKLKKEMAYEI